jgi:hypothetical protein
VARERRPHFMKPRIYLFVSIAAAAVLVPAWVARKPASPAPLLADVPTRQEPEPRQGARRSVIDAVDPAAASHDRDRQLALEIGSAVVSNDIQRRETAFAVLLPELLRADPARVADMVARTPSGDARDALVHEVARQWITRDTAAAVAWLQSLGEERAEAASVAVRALAAVSPAQAIDAADRLDVGRDDGSVEHIMQMWAAESPREAKRWLDNQPESARTAQLRARLPR